MIDNGLNTVLSVRCLSVLLLCTWLANRASYLLDPAMQVIRIRLLLRSLLGDSNSPWRSGAEENLYPPILGMVEASVSAYWEVQIRKTYMASSFLTPSLDPQKSYREKAGYANH